MKKDLYTKVKSGFQLLWKSEVRFYIVLLLVWLISCQICFYFFQQNSAEQMKRSLQNQLQQELDYSNFQYISRSITVFQNSGAIRCAQVSVIAPSRIEVIDLRYMNLEQSCTPNSLSLDGQYVDVDLTSLNGSVFKFRFVNENDFLFYLALWGFRLFGLLLVFMAYRNLGLRLDKERLLQAVEMAQTKAIADLSRRVAHDIRSPLSALNAVANFTGEFSIQHREIIKTVVGRINGIADGLLIKNISGQSDSKKKSDILETDILNLFRDLVREKNLEYSNHSVIKIDLRSSSAVEAASVSMPLILLSRIVSNLINNSVEAIVENGLIVLELSAQSNQLVIDITDFGKGIDSDILQQLGTREISVGKVSNSGHGIGLHSAFTEVRRYSGEILIQSKVGVGTRITIRLPITK